jgi:hypothetical protein
MVSAPAWLQKLAAALSHVAVPKAASVFQLKRSFAELYLLLLFETYFLSLNNYKALKHHCDHT